MVKAHAVTAAAAAANRSITPNEANTINNGTMLTIRCYGCEDAGFACYADAGGKCGRCTTRGKKCAPYSAVATFAAVAAFDATTLANVPRVAAGAAALPYPISVRMNIPPGITITRPDFEQPCFEVGAPAVPGVVPGVWIGIPPVAPAVAPAAVITQAQYDNLERSIFLNATFVAGAAPAYPAPYGLLSRVRSLEHRLATIDGTLAANVSCACAVVSPPDGGGAGAGSGGDGADGGGAGGAGGDGDGFVACTKTPGCPKPAKHVGKCPGMKHKKKG